MSHSTLVKQQLAKPLRGLALTVEEAGPDSFRWRILESGQSSGQKNGQSAAMCISVCRSNNTYSACDAALANNYDKLRRLSGPDLQYGPRVLEPMNLLRCGTRELVARGCRFANLRRSCLAIGRP